MGWQNGIMAADFTVYGNFDFCGDYLRHGAVKKTVKVGDWECLPRPVGLWRRQFDRVIHQHHPAGQPVQPVLVRNYWNSRCDYTCVSKLFAKIKG